MIGAGRVGSQPTRQIRIGRGYAWVKNPPYGLRSAGLEHWNLGHWNLFGIWDSVLGISE
jgi:hypothetical protein